MKRYSSSPPVEVTLDGHQVSTEAHRFTPSLGLQEIVNELGLDDVGQLTHALAENLIYTPGVCAKCRAVHMVVQPLDTHADCDNCGSAEVRSALVLMESLHAQK